MAPAAPPRSKRYRTQRFFCVLGAVCAQKVIWGPNVRFYQISPIFMEMGGLGPEITIFMIFHHLGPSLSKSSSPSKATFYALKRNARFAVS